jgi:hypothetical protein
VIDALRENFSGAVTRKEVIERTLHGEHFCLKKKLLKNKKIFYHQSEIFYRDFFSYIAETRTPLKNFEKSRFFREKVAIFGSNLTPKNGGFP